MPTGLWPHPSTPPNLGQHLFPVSSEQSFQENSLCACPSIFDQVRVPMLPRGDYEVLTPERSLHAWHLQTLPCSPWAEELGREPRGLQALPPYPTPVPRPSRPAPPQGLAGAGTTLRLCCPRGQAKGHMWPPST